LIQMLDTSAKDGVKPGNWAGKTDSGHVISFIVGSNGKQILNLLVLKASGDTLIKQKNTITISDSGIALDSNGLILLFNDLAFKGIFHYSSYVTFSGCIQEQQTCDGFTGVCTSVCLQYGSGTKSLSINNDYLTPDDTGTAQ
jgi:hypothetical protein